MSRRLAAELRTETLLGMIAQLQTARSERLLKPLGLTRSKLAVLRFVVEHDNTTVTEMANRLELKQPAITKIVKYFIDNNFIKPVSVKSDRRQKTLYATPDGRKLYEDVIDQLMPAISLPYEDWSIKNLDFLGNQLEKIKDWLDENRYS